MGKVREPQDPICSVYLTHLPGKIEVRFRDHRARAWKLRGFGSKKAIGRGVRKQNYGSFARCTRRTCPLNNVYGNGRFDAGIDDRCK